MFLAKPLVDFRVYTIALRKMPEFLEVFDRLAMPILRETLGTSARLLDKSGRAAEPVHPPVGV